MKTFYRPEMNVSGNISFSPSAGKPKKFIDYLIKNNLSLNLDSNFSALSRSDFYLAHSKTFVDAVLELERSNGFSNKSKEIADSLPFTSGSFFSAAQYALEKNENTFSPTSGFHHASFLSPSGFCTFNGLMISAIKIKEMQLANRIGIIDCDQHYGDGTDDIIKKLKTTYVKHYTFGGEGISPGYADRWLIDFEKIVSEFYDVEIIFYQAGADPHIDDPLGGTLTSEQMRRRDEILFSTAKKLGIPIVWNLAGGYQTPIENVLELHKTTYLIANECSR